jgi:hypothetical protein
MKSTIMTAGVFTLLAMQAQAHHSFAPHFDSSKPVDIAGVVVEFEQRNPHAYLHIAVQGADGRTSEWNCESHGVTQLTRNGITPEMLTPGTVVRIKGSQHRRDPLQCFFDSVEFEDGRVLSVNGQRNAPPPPQVAQRDSLFGTWLLVPTGRPTSGPQDMMEFITDAARVEIEKYNPFTDDPTYRCEPVAIRRGWFAPGTPMAIRQAGDDIVIQHEWMDIERVVHMNQAATPADEPESILGYSRGHWEGDTLVVETDRFNQGVLNQFVEVEGQPMRGLLHSNALRTVERIRFLPDSNRIHMSIEHYDPVFFTQDFPVAEAEYEASDLEIKPFGCLPEILK